MNQLSAPYHRSKALRRGLLVLSLTATISAAHAQSTYNSDYANADYSGMTATGGTVIVPMVLASGTPLAGIGNSFNVTFTISPITSYFAPPGTHTWATPTVPTTLGYYGFGFPDNLYTSLPVSNTNPLPRTINGVTYDDGNGIQWTLEGIEEGLFQYIGGFTISSSLLPTSPDGYFVSHQEVLYGQGWYYSFDETQVLGGMASYVADWQSIFGGSVNYDFVAFNGGETPFPDPGGPI